MGEGEHQRFVVQKIQRIFVHQYLHAGGEILVRLPEPQDQRQKGEQGQLIGHVALWLGDTAQCAAGAIQRGGVSGEPGAGVLEKIAVLGQGTALNGAETGHVDPLVGQVAQGLGIAQHVVNGHGFVIAGGVGIFRRPCDSAGAAVDAVIAGNEGDVEGVGVVGQAEFADHGSLIVAEKDRRRGVAGFVVVGAAGRHGSTSRYSMELS